MGELTGRLIEMNAHMVRTGDACGMMIIGMIIGITLVIFAVASYADCGWQFSVVLGAIAIIGFVVFFVGMNKPRVKEIKMCADGPVSIEQIATRYEIMKIDGKELTLRER